jgi:hypothetical protein
VGVGFAVLCPDKLQSEDFQLRHQALVMFQQKGEAPQLIDPTTIVAIANPALEQKSSAGESE